MLYARLGMGELCLIVRPLRIIMPNQRLSGLGHCCKAIVI